MMKSSFTAFIVVYMRNRNGIVCLSKIMADRSLRALDALIAGSVAFGIETG